MCFSLRARRRSASFGPSLRASDSLGRRTSQVTSLCFSASRDSLPLSHFPPTTSCPHDAVSCLQLVASSSPSNQLNVSSRAERTLRLVSRLRCSVPSSRTRWVWARRLMSDMASDPACVGRFSQRWVKLVSSHSLSHAPRLVPTSARCELNPSPSRSQDTEDDTISTWVQLPRAGYSFRVQFERDFETVPPRASDQQQQQQQPQQQHAPESGRYQAEIYAAYLTFSEPFVVDAAGKVLGGGQQCFYKCFGIDLDVYRQRLPPWFIEGQFGRSCFPLVSIDSCSGTSS